MKWIYPTVLVLMVPGFILASLELIRMVFALARFTD